MKSRKYVIQRSTGLFWEDFFTYNKHLEAAVRLRELREECPGYTWQLVERKETGR